METSKFKCRDLIYSVEKLNKLKFNPFFTNYVVPVLVHESWSVTLILWIG